ncbi:Hsp70 family protein [Micromonospora sp. MMS20-R1-14]|uniref:Hsp70 family protein n=1 Tax=Micromonospora humida TaxID=2809018 RepID=A0ABS2IZV2_9ACTN|nr:Hsp70 family protein [Micromonospora humida]
MEAGETRLSIDCGSASTVAVLAWPDGRASVLPFDGLPYLPSGLFLAEDGQVWTGRRAWQAAETQPHRFVPNPRRTNDGELVINGSEAEAVEFAAAPLRRAAAEAEGVVGEPVRDVRLVVPAGWGPRRRTWMRQVAHRAGLGQPRLVEAPVAVTEHLVATGVRLTVGSFVVVCDVGAGAEVTVLRRGPAGFEVLATLADPAAGGAAVDLALTAAVLHGREVPAGGMGQWAMAESVRVAKETLGSHPAVTVPVAGHHPVIADRAMLDAAAQPVVRRVAELTQQCIAAADLTSGDLAGIYCVGGSAHLPRLDAAIAEHTGVTPMLVAEPQLIAARGAAEVGAPAVGVGAVEVTVPPIRRAVAIAVPGLASLALLWQALLTAERNNTLSAYYYVLFNLGELTMAAVFALVACIAAGTILGSLIAARSPTPELRTEGGKVSIGILAGVSLGVAIAALYAVVISQYFGLPLRGFLTWALWPIAPTAVLAVVMAIIAARQWRTPSGGWSTLLATPTGSVVTAAVGMGLIQYARTADRWPHLVVWLDLTARIGGLLLGIGTVMALVTPLIFRIVLAAPIAVISAAIVTGQSTGILGVSYAIAITVWWAARVWTRLIHPTTGPTTLSPPGRGG